MMVPICSAPPVVVAVRHPRTRNDYFDAQLDRFGFRNSAEADPFSRTERLLVPAVSVAEFIRVVAECYGEAVVEVADVDVR